jgi:hypothetical protein
MHYAELADEATGDAKRVNASSGSSNLMSPAETVAQESINPSSPIDATPPAVEAAITGDGGAPS